MSSAKHTKEYTFFTIRFAFRTANRGRPGVLRTAKSEPMLLGWTLRFRQNKVGPCRLLAALTNRRLFRGGGCCHLKFFPQKYRIYFAELHHSPVSARRFLTRLSEKALAVFRRLRGV
jgi:hypothetical protein